ncbi:tRNA (adenosine(37)-N6)-threonylcarbamoyltransferase complex ATPase subunit type 1 TsaE [Candidatus Saccharibacteria bacterium]|nr:tRNA (adenosine(37)-N6)-threonylcarbamoyltransferase complex ATPase subunit type 1 TsaE [Candidatus Saccharibacteria bacterium]
MKVNSEQEMLNLGEEFAKKCQTPKDFATVIELIGDVGAGKTTFTRGLAKGLEIEKAITSPSFTIAKSYALSSGGTFVHYDFYRLPDPGIMIEDLEENLKDSRNIIVIEWGETVAELLPKNHYKITINYNDDGSREVTI